MSYRIVITRFAKQSQSQYCIRPVEFATITAIKPNLPGSEDFFHPQCVRFPGKRVQRAAYPAADGVDGHGKIVEVHLAGNHLFDPWLWFVKGDMPMNADAAKTYIYPPNLLNDPWQLGNIVLIGE